MPTTLQEKVSPAEVREALVEARALIARPWAWFKGALYSVRSVKTRGGAINVDCYCAVGALQRVTGTPLGTPLGGRRDQAVYRAAMNHLQSALLASGSRTSSVPAFNDHRSTTKKDILALFDRAISSIKEK